MGITNAQREQNLKIGLVCGHKFAKQGGKS